jgi:hypothetical protein
VCCLGHSCGARRRGLLHRLPGVPSGIYALHDLLARLHHLLSMGTGDAHTVEPQLRRLACGTCRRARLKGGGGPQRQRVALPQGWLDGCDSAEIPAYLDDDACEG